MNKDIFESRAVSPDEEKNLIFVASFVHKIISRKLGARHRDWVEDLKQKVLLKLWRWQNHQGGVELTEEEWKKLANVTARCEVIDFFREKYRRDVPFSQLNDGAEREVKQIESTEELPGNSKPEICSLVKLIWRTAQNLTLRQKYAFFLHFSDFIIEFIVCECCSIRELASYFELSESELSVIIDRLPISEAEIGKLIAAKIGRTMTPKQIWEARAKAKVKLAAQLRDFVFNERSPVRKRD